MGNRANVHFIDSENSDGIFLYTHWDGDELPLIVKKTLARKLRWDDPSYLCRMIFCAMVSDDVDGETGYGISTYEVDSNHPDIVVDCMELQVRIAEHKWSFEDYIELSDDDISGACCGDD